MSEVVIVDSGVANLASVTAAFQRLGATVRIAQDVEAVRRAQRLVLPGVGAFGAAIRSLRSRGLDDEITAAISSGKPVLAICLGMQALAEASEECPGVRGLGVVPGTCRRLPDGFLVPHLGWNVVHADAGCRVLGTMEAAFANSFALLEAPDSWGVAWSVQGDGENSLTRRRGEAENSLTADSRFVAAIERENVVGCQFHPELSGEVGHALLRRWLTGERSRDELLMRRGGLASRIVPCLDVDDGRVVKGVRFNNLRDAGDPAECAARYEAQGADEIVVLDITASSEKRDTRLDTIRKVRARLGIPLTVGGGVRSVDGARKLLVAGADKVSVNTAAVERPVLLTELSSEFGSQCVVLAIDARRASGSWEVLTRGGRDVALCLDAIVWAQRGAAAGAGEILLTSWDRDGTRSGCDLELLRAVSSAVNVPVIASGGIGSRADVVQAIEAGADAVLAASVLHDGEDTVAGIKAELQTRGLAVRL